MRSCSSCGETELPAQSRFCLHCGAALDPEDATGAAPYTPEHLTRDVLVFRDAEGGERKEVTVLIADVAGSLAMADALDPEDVHALMDGFFALALEAVHAQLGTVNQFRGDGFMALFGAPRARGDDAARALRAALEVRERSRDYAESVRARYGVPFAVRIGVSTGRVWVGAIGNDLRRDYTAEGPTVGLAARLEALAAPSQILVSEETARRGAGFELLDQGARAVRGLSEPVRVFELLGEKPPSARLGAELDRGQSPFVGRAAELAQLRRSLRGGGLRCIELRGEAGIGKSRLVLEALRGLPPGVAVLDLVCREASTRRAYVPWLHLLRRWPADLPGAAAAERLALAIDGNGSKPCEPAAAADALRSLVSELLAARGVVIVVDDAHWLDPSSRRLLQQLVAEPPSGPLAVIATLRDDQAADWGAPVQLERIELAPLLAHEARHLAETAGELEESLADLACLRGGGNPLFIEEVARALRDGSPDLREAARLEVSLARARERIPDTLWGVVAARIDALPENAKRVLEMAAVVGEPFDKELVSDVLSGLGDEPPALLELLVGRGLLRAAAGAEYDFCHGVVRAGAEAQLVRERLKSLHRRIADALAKRPFAASAEGASRIGGHYDRAGEPHAAIPLLLRAGRAYTEMRALFEAVAHLRRAFELLRSAGSEDPGLESSVGLALASTLGALDRTGEAAAVLESIDTERAGAEDRVRLATVHVQAGWLRFSNDNDVARGRALVERGLRAVEGLRGGEDTRLLAWSYLTRIDLLDGQLEQALVSARQLAEHASGRGDSASLGIARYNECWVHCEAGRIAAAHAAAADALALAEGSPNDLVRAMAECARARVLYFEGDSTGALAGARRAGELAERCGQLGFRSHALVVAGYAHLLRGDARAAHESFEALTPLGAQWPSTLLHRARGALEISELQQAAELARRALDAPRAIRARALAVLGLALGLGAGRADEGESALDQAASECDALGLRPWLAEAQGFLAELCARRGDRARAIHYATRAADGYARCEMPVHAAQLRRLLET